MIFASCMIVKQRNRFQTCSGITEGEFDVKCARETRARK